MTEKFSEFKKQIEQMNEIERAKLVAEMWKGFSFALEDDKRRGKNLNDVNPFWGPGYFWRIINICSNASGEHLMGKEEYEKWSKERLAKQEQAEKELKERLLKNKLENIK